MLAFVTVGSTKFDALVQATISEPVLTALHSKGFVRVVLQRGNSDFDLGCGAPTPDSLTIRKAGVDIETWMFKPSIQDDIEHADLVISHGGSGTVLDVLRSGKPLIVVPNPTLMDNHQEELALQLDSLDHLRATSVDDLPATIASFDLNALIPFPAFDGSKFRRLVDEMMGFTGPGHVTDLVHDVVRSAWRRLSMRSVTPASVAGDFQAYEDQHVHAVYDQIATHFSSTRYKVGYWSCTTPQGGSPLILSIQPWPIIAKFISDLPSGWIGLDSGTGNGKYLPLPAHRSGSVLTVGLDRSRSLLLIARNAGGELTAPVVREVVWGDVLDNGWRAGAFDYAISIATIHHLASYERRRLAVERLLQCVSPAHGRIMIYVWAIEQDELSKRVIPVDVSIKVPSSPSGKDVFVPWVMSQQGPARNQATKLPVENALGNSGTIAEAPVYHRYYHMFAKGELTRLTCETAQGMGLVVGPPEEGRRGIEIIQDGWERSNYYVELRCWKT
ncbi:glycosyltransferase family 28 [Butyriboletus roseoflavus]|nr:glycosyltransferase family 28 [Butyriboletus roseoflavus]